MKMQTELHDYIAAGFSGIWIETKEPFEAQREIAKLANANEWLLLCWDVAKGLFTLADGPMNQAVGDPIAALKALTGKTNETSLLLLHNFHRFLSNVQLLQTLANAIEEGKATRTFFIILSPTIQIPIELQHAITIITHELPDTNALNKIAKELDIIDPPPKAISAASGLTRNEAEGAFALSIARHTNLTPSEIFTIKASTLKKAGLLTLHQGNETFDKLGGLAAIKTFCLAAMNGPKASSAKGIMLLGVPGAGKSTFAKALGNATERPVLALDIGSLFGSLVGQTEERVRQALCIADEMQPCILFVDEIEKALAGTNSNNDSGVASRMLGTLLTWLSDHTSNVFCITTCNGMDRLPPEFSRAERWDGIYFLDIPTTKEREAIWQIWLTHYNLPTHSERPNDLDWTGAEIRSCCRLAVLMQCTLKTAALNVTPITKTDPDRIQSLRNWANNRCLSANTPGLYTINSQPPAERRKISKAVAKAIARKEPAQQ